MIFGCGKSKPDAIPFAVAGYVAAAIYFTSSTCFANPAVTIARMFTDTLTGIQPAHVPAYIAAQLVGAGLACAVFGWLFADKAESTIESVRASLEHLKDLEVSDETKLNETDAIPVGVSVRQ